MNTAQILRAAAALVRKDFWQYGTLRSDGALCAHLAIDQIDQLQCRAVCHALCCALGFPQNALYIHEWNDAPDQTAEGVAVGLEYAALIWEQEQQHTAAPSAAESLVPCNRS